MRRRTAHINPDASDSGWLVATDVFVYIYIYIYMLNAKHAYSQWSAQCALYATGGLYDAMPTESKDS